MVCCCLLCRFRLLVGVILVSCDLREWFGDFGWFAVGWQLVGFGCCL